MGKNFKGVGFDIFPGTVPAVTSTVGEKSRNSKGNRPIFEPDTAETTCSMYIIFIFGASKHRDTYTHIYI